MPDRIELTPRRILFEDDALIAVDKPSGLVSHATVDPTRDHLVACVQRFFAARDSTAGHLMLAHRLDRGTSGVVVLSRDPVCDAALAETFATRTAQKTYLAIAKPRDGAAVVAQQIDAYLAPGRGPRGTTKVVRSGGQPARTDVQPLLRRDGLVLVQARPATGRTHQIRVHLAHVGLPLLGDDLYGVSDPDAKRLMLHAWRLQLPHPGTGEPLTLEAPWPRAFRRRFDPADVE